MTGAPPEPPYDALPPDAPATVEDVRSSRRWTWVALAWAVAASAIAVIALVSATSADDETTTQTQPDLTPRVEKLENDTSERLDAFGRRLGDRAAKSDVQKLDRRLSQVEDDAASARKDAQDQAGAIDQLRSDVDDLQQRVDDLESQQDQQQSQQPGQ